MVVASWSGARSTARIRRRGGAKVSTARKGRTQWCGGCGRWFVLSAGPSIVARPFSLWSRRFLICCFGALVSFKQWSYTCEVRAEGRRLDMRDRSQCHRRDVADSGRSMDGGCSKSRLRYETGADDRRREQGGYSVLRELVDLVQVILRRRVQGAAN